MSAYSSAKAAVIGFTKSLGKELATRNIVVNAVTPAVIETDILAQVSPATVEYMVSRIPMSRTRPTRGGGGVGGLAVVRRVLVLDRRGVRYQRRPRDVLIVGADPATPGRRYQMSPTVKPSGNGSVGSTT